MSFFGYDFGLLDHIPAGRYVSDSDNSGTAAAAPAFEEPPAGGTAVRDNLTGTWWSISLNSSNRNSHTTLTTIAAVPRTIELLHSGSDHRTNTDETSVAADGITILSSVPSQNNIEENLQQQQQDIDMATPPTFEIYALSPSTRSALSMSTTETLYQQLSAASIASRSNPHNYMSASWSSALSLPSSLASSVVTEFSVNYQDTDIDASSYGSGSDPYRRRHRSVGVRDAELARAMSTLALTLPRTAMESTTTEPTAWYTHWTDTDWDRFGAGTMELLAVLQEDSTEHPDALLALLIQREEEAFYNHHNQKFAHRRKYHCCNPAQVLGNVAWIMASAAVASLSTTAVLFVSRR
jgi:hypothetical protein